MSVVALFVWGDSGFADLDYRDTLRLVVPAATMLILGVQTVLASFFISILGIQRTARSAERDRGRLTGKARRYPRAGYAERSVAAGA